MTKKPEETGLAMQATRNNTIKLEDRMDSYEGMPEYVFINTKLCRAAITAQQYNIPVHSKKTLANIVHASAWLQTIDGVVTEKRLKQALEMIKEVGQNNLSSHLRATQNLANADDWRAYLFLIELDGATYSAERKEQLQKITALGVEDPKEKGALMWVLKSGSIKLADLITSASHGLKETIQKYICEAAVIAQKGNISVTSYHTLETIHQLQQVKLGSPQPEVVAFIEKCDGQSRVKALKAIKTLLPTNSNPTVADIEMQMKNR